MCFQKDAVSANCNPCSGHVFNKFRSASAYPARLVGLLQGMGNIQYYGGILFHGRYTPKINDHIVVSEHGPTIGDPNLFIACVGLGREELEAERRGVAVEDVGDDQRGQRPALEVGDLQGVVELHPVSGSAQPVAELDVDGRPLASGN